MHASKTQHSHAVSQLIHRTFSYRTGNHHWSVPFSCCLLILYHREMGPLGRDADCFAEQPWFRPFPRLLACCCSPLCDRCSSVILLPTCCHLNTFISHKIQMIKAQPPRLPLQSATINDTFLQLGGWT